jgi:diguanylate cyclase (GGDEF)-like protein
MALFVSLATAGLLPFFIYRTLAGQYTSALINGVTLAILLIVFAYSWVSGRTAGARLLVVAYLGIACVFMVVVAERMPYWVFPIVVANFMLVSWKIALGVNVLMLIAVATGAAMFEDPADTVSFFAAVAMVGMFSMIFVIHTNFHRDRLNEMVARDALTGALNRRLLRDDLTDAITRSTRHSQPVAVALLDLDNFKQVNDTQGHDVGDQVLIDLTDIVEQQSRKSDRFYRLGGEEFVLLLNQTDREGAETALSKLMALLREHLRSPTGPVTVSIGVAMHRPDETWSQWLARADQAMYRAKSEGKDRVVFAD